MNITTDAPGLRRRARSDGDAWYWIAAAVSRHARDYPQKAVRLYYDTAEERAARCRALTEEFRLWLAQDGRTERTGYDGTLRSLINLYQTLDTSPYFRVQENTRGDYNQRLRDLRHVVGDSEIDALNAVDFTRWHREFKKPAKEGGAPLIRKAHGLITMVRMLMSFGKSMRLAGCKECVEVLEEMRFEAPGKRTQALTFAQAEKIVDLALAAGRRSLALGQALQFELAMRQVDVIGKWTAAEPNSGGIGYRGNRWGGGLLWSDVTADLTVSKVTTKTAADGMWDLRTAPLVMKALDAYPAADRVGPMVVSELTDLPYDRFDYARDWRPFADQAGVPKDVWNRDSRAGGITEGWDADGQEKDLQRLATHSNPASTRRYARGSLESSRRVAGLRVARRKQVKNAGAGTGVGT